MNVDFFRVEVSDGVSIGKILRGIKLLPQKNSTKRTRDLGKVPFRMRVLAKDKRFWDGDMVRIRMDDVPVITSKKGREASIRLDDDEGVGERTAFRYDVRTHVLVIEVTRSGVSASKWGSYLEEMAGIDDAILPVVIQSPLDAQRTIDRLDVVRRIHIRYAGAIDASAIVNPMTTTAKTIAELANTAPVVEIAVAMGHESGGLDLSWSKRLLAEAWRKAKEWAGTDKRVERIDVVGTFDDDEKAKLNLLQFLMREDVAVKTSRRNRRAPYGERRSGIIEAWGRRASQLERMFPKPKGR